MPPSGGCWAASTASVPSMRRRLPVEPREPGVEDVELLRRAAAEATVLLCNDGVLPLDPASLRKVAVIGDHAATPRIQGGGSARVVQRAITAPADALVASLGPGVEVVLERGCEVDRSATVIGTSVMRAPDGFAVDVYDGLALSGDVVHTTKLDDLRLFVLSGEAQGYPDADWSMRVRGTVIPDESGVFELALAQSGRARVLLDGTVILDGFGTPPPAGGTDFFGFASQELVADVELVAGSPVEITVEYARIETMLAGVRVGFRTRDADGLLERAVAAARDADVAVVFAGTTFEWETEGRDRTTLALPGRQDELVRLVAAANPLTVVVVNAGAPVDLPWADDVAAVLQCWFGGDQMAPAVADVLIGRSEPGGRLPTTVPVRLEHSPSHDNFPGENGELRYGEGLFMGYRGYEHRCLTPRYPFGHGLGYTRFAFGEVTLSSPTFTPGGSVSVSVEVTNVGDRPGTEVVQCYVAPGESRLSRPPKELKAFARVNVAPGETAAVELRLDDRSFAYWDPGQPEWDELVTRLSAFQSQFVGQQRRSPGWQVDAGRYEVLIGRSSADIVGRATIEVKAS